MEGLITVPRRGVSRPETAAYPGVCEETFVGFGIKSYNLGQRMHRYDIADIDNWVRLQEEERETTKCKSIKGKARHSSGYNTTGTDRELEKVLALPTAT